MSKDTEKKKKQNAAEAAENTAETVKEAAEEVTEAAEKAEKPKKQRNMKKLKFGSMSVVVLVLVIAIVIVINLMVSVLSRRMPMKIDLTPDNRFELSDESIQVLKDLDKDVDITVTTTKDTFASMAAYFKQMYMSYYGMNVDMPYEMIPEILDKYSVYAESGKGSVTVRYVDINKDPDVVNRYNQYYKGEIGEGSIVIASGERVKVISNEDVIGMITSSSASTQTNLTMVFAGESTLTSAIMNVTDANPVTAGIIKTVTGNSIYDSGYESMVTSLEELLAKNGYDCEDVDLGTNALSPEDYDLLVLPVPAYDLTADVISSLGDFLYNGGRYERDLLYIPSLYSGELPNLAEFLADWSIEVSDYVIMDDQAKMVQTPVVSLNSIAYSPVLTVSDTDSVGVLPNETLPIVSPFTKALNILSKNNDSVASAVLQSSDTSYLVATVEGADVPEDTGAKNAAVISKKETAEQFDVYTSHVLVLGSSFIADSALLNYTSTYNNASAVLNMVNSMTGKESGTVIPEKTLQQNVIAPTAGQAAGIRVFVIYIIPAVIAIAGIVVLLRRRNK